MLLIRQRLWAGRLMLPLTGAGHAFFILVTGMIKSSIKERMALSAEVCYRERKTRCGRFAKCHPEKRILLNSLRMLHKISPRPWAVFFYARLLVCLAAMIFWTSPALGRGLPAREDIAFDLFINDRFDFFNNFIDSSQRKFDQDLNLHIVYVNAALTAHLREGLLGALEIEEEFIYDIDDEDLDDELDVRNAYLQAVVPGLPWMALTAGRLAFSTANSLIYDDEAPALRLQADIERGFAWPFRLQVLAARVEDSSPYIHAELKYQHSFLESITFFYGRYHDDRDGVARIFNYLEQERAYRSKSTITWTGLSVRKFLGDLFFRGTYIYEHGSTRLQHRDQGRHTLQMRSYLADLNCDYNFNKRLSVSLFLFLASGDSSPDSRTLRSFISIDPYIDKTNIFFNGGIDSQFSSDNVGLNGIQLPGVICPGIAASYQLTRNARIKAVCAYLSTQTGTGGDGTTYGWETDLMGYYNVRPNLQLCAEMNILFPGKYFRTFTNHNTHTAAELIIGISYLFSM